MYNSPILGKDHILTSLVVEYPAASDDLLVQVRAVLGDALQLDGREGELAPGTPLVGSLPELDSMAVLTVITALEEHFHFVVDDDDDVSRAFQTLGSLAEYVAEKTRR